MTQEDIKKVQLLCLRVVDMGEAKRRIKDLRDSIVNAKDYQLAQIHLEKLSETDNRAYRFIADNLRKYADTLCTKAIEHLDSEIAKKAEELKHVEEPEEEIG